MSSSRGNRSRHSSLTVGHRGTDRRSAASGGRDRQRTPDLGVSDCRSGRRPIVSSSGGGRCIAGACESGSARSRCRGAAALLSEAERQPRPSVQCTPTFARMTASNRRAHASPAAGGAWEQQSAAATPRRRDLESRRPRARRVTRGSPRPQHCRLAIRCSGSSSRGSGRLLPRKEYRDLTTEAVAKASPARGRRDDRSPAMRSSRGWRGCGQAHR